MNIYVIHGYTSLVYLEWYLPGRHSTGSACRSCGRSLLQFDRQVRRVLSQHPATQRIKDHLDLEEKTQKRRRHAEEMNFPDGVFQCNHSAKRRETVKATTGLHVVPIQNGRVPCKRNASIFNSVLGGPSVRELLQVCVYKYPE